MPCFCPRCPLLPISRPFRVSGRGRPRSRTSDPPRLPSRSPCGRTDQTGTGGASLWLYFGGYCLAVGRRGGASSSQGCRARLKPRRPQDCCLVLRVPEATRKKPEKAKGTWPQLPNAPHKLEWSCRDFERQRRQSPSWGRVVMVGGLLRAGCPCDEASCRVINLVKPESQPPTPTTSSPPPTSQGQPHPHWPRS